ncbi:MAG: ABC transporter permease [Patescibacteria group bacterium]|nr:ABC transporter permease [Patescibacteria group bacterium]
MRIRDSVNMAWASLIRNKGRAVLTMLGIVIGTASVILMLSVGQAAEQYIMSQVASFGSDMIFVENGPGDGMQGSGPPTTSIKQTLTMKDFRKLKQLSWIRLVDADYMSSLLVEFGGLSRTRGISGSSENGLNVYDAEIARGNFFTAEDVDARARSAVIGSGIADEFFGQEDPIGKQIKIDKRPYHVIGVLKPAGTRFFTNLDKQIYVPVTTLMQDLNVEHIQFMALRIGNTPPNEAKERIRVLLRDQHNLDNPTGDLAKDDFFVSSQEDAQKVAGSIGNILQILLVSIAAISLIVGGVGIMNIMFVSVTERTREIGLRKAVGAKQRDILGQFLAEAVLLCICGGLIGVVSGIGFSWLGIKALQAFQSPNWTFIMPINGIFLGLGVSTAIGVVFGYYPAKKAAELNPIQALQYE